MAEVTEVQDKILEAMARFLEKQIGGPAISTRAVADLAEAWAWLERPDQPHAGR